MGKPQKFLPKKQLLQEQAELFNTPFERSPLQEVCTCVRQITIGITCGDLNGIGFEAIIKTLQKWKFSTYAHRSFLASKVASTTATHWI